jgi:hypothetical protein
LDSSKFSSIFNTKTPQNSKKINTLSFTILICKSHHKNTTKLSRNVYENFSRIFKGFWAQEPHNFLTKMVNILQENTTYFFDQDLAHNNTTEMSGKQSRMHGKFLEIFKGFFEYAGVQLAGNQ